MDLFVTWFLVVESESFSRSPVNFIWFTFLFTQKVVKTMLIKCNKAVG